MNVVSTADRAALAVFAVLLWAAAAAASVIVILTTIGWFGAAAPSFSLAADALAPGLPGTATFTAAEITFALSTGARVLFAGATITGLAWAAAAAAGGYLFWAAARGARFRPALTVFARVAGIALALGAVLKFGLSFAATAAAFQELGTPDTFAPGAAFDLGQLLLGLTIAALAYLFQRGRRLEQDVEGLV